MKPVADSSCTSVYLLRHGECEGGDIFRGQTDSLLSALGQQQMASRLSKLTQQPIDRVISSPALRCRQAAESFALQHNIRYQTEPAFLEISFGDWEGRKVADVAQASPERLERFWRDPVSYTPPNGESLLQFQQRIQAAWQALLRDYCGQTLVLVTHGGVIRILLAQLLGMPLRPLSHIAVPHGCLSLLRYYHQAGKPDWPQMVFHNGGLSGEN